MRRRRRRGGGLVELTRQGARAVTGRRDQGRKDGANAAAGQGERHREDVRRAEEKEDGGGAVKRVERDE